MMDRIEIGNYVDVSIQNRLIGEYLEVIHKPQATGDSWIFKNGIDGDLYYISEGCTITKHRA